MRNSTLRWTSLGIAAGAIVWAACGLAAGPLAEDELNRLELAGSLAFQVGVLCLVGVLWATEATGRSRWGRAMLAVQTVLVLLAMGWTVPHVVDPDMVDRGFVVALDAAWPLSILWLIVQGIAVVRAHTWPDRVRWMPLVASLWAPVSILAFVAGEWPGLVISNLWLAVTYGALGALVIAHLADGSITPVPPSSRSTVRVGSAISGR